MSYVHDKHPGLRRWASWGSVVGLAIFLLTVLLKLDMNWARAGMALFAVSMLTGVVLRWLAVAGYPDVRAPTWLWGVPVAGIIILPLGVYVGVPKIAWVVGGGLVLLGMGLIAATSWLHHQ